MVRGSGRGRGRCAGGGLVRTPIISRKLFIPPPSASWWRRVTRYKDSARASKGLKVERRAGDGKENEYKQKDP